MHECVSSRHCLLGAATDGDEGTWPAVRETPGVSTQQHAAAPPRPAHQPAPHHRIQLDQAAGLEQRHTLTKHQPTVPHRAHPLAMPCGSLKCKCEITATRHGLQNGSECSMRTASASKSAWQPASPSAAHVLRQCVSTTPTGPSAMQTTLQHVARSGGTVKASLNQRASLNSRCTPMQSPGLTCACLQHARHSEQTWRDCSSHSRASRPNGYRAHASCVRPLQAGIRTTCAPHAVCCVHTSGDSQRKSYCLTRTGTTPRQRASACKSAGYAHGYFAVLCDRAASLQARPRHRTSRTVLPSTRATRAASVLRVGIGGAPLRTAPPGASVLHPHRCYLPPTSSNSPPPPQTANPHQGPAPRMIKLPLGLATHPCRSSLSLILVTRTCH